METRGDPSLPLPDLPLLETSLGDLEAGLVRSGVGDERRFTLGGRRAFATGGVDGLYALGVYPVRILGPLRVTGARTDALTVTPAGVVRRSRVEGALLEERLVVAPDGPLAWMEWRADGAAVELELTGSVVLGGAEAGGPLRWRSSSRSLLFTLAGESGRGATRPLGLLVFSRPPDRFDAGVHDGTGDVAGAGNGLEGSGLRVRIVVSLQPGESIQMGVAGDISARTLRMLGRPEVAVTARRAAVARAADERLTLESPDPRLDEALEWAKHGLASLVAETPGVGRSIVAGHEGEDEEFGRSAYRTHDAIYGALAAAATGDPASAATVLRFLAAHPLETGGIPVAVTCDGRIEGGPADPALFLLLAGRYLEWTGDLRTVKAIWPVVQRVVATAGRPESRVWPAAMESLRHVAAELGEAPLVSASAGETAGETAGEGAPEAVPAALEVPGGPAHGALSLAGVVAGIVDGLLGVEPDATRGRLVLRPRPGSRSRLRVRNLVVGEAAVDLHYRREEGVGGWTVHRFTLDQTRGAVPLRVIFEPELAGGRVRAARVDGERADLEPVRLADGWRVPVQLVLDHRRSMEVELDGDAG